MNKSFIYNTIITKLKGIIDLNPTKEDDHASIHTIKGNSSTSSSNNSNNLPNSLENPFPDDSGYFQLSTLEQRTTGRIRQCFTVQYKNKQNNYLQYAS